MVHAGVLGLLVLVVGASAQGLFEFPHRSQEDITNRPGFLTSVPVYRPNTSCRLVLPGLWRCVKTQASEEEPFRPRLLTGFDSDELNSDDDSDMEGPRTSSWGLRAGLPAPRRHHVATLGDVINRIRARAGLPPLRLPESSPEQSEEPEASSPKDDSEEQPRILIVQRPEITVEPEGIAVRRRTIILVVRGSPDSFKPQDSDEEADVADTTTAEPIETTTNDDVLYATSGNKFFRGSTVTTSAPSTVRPYVMVTTPAPPAPTETSESTSTEGTTPRVASSTENEIDTSTSFETTTPRMKMVGPQSESREELDMPEDVELLQRRNGNRERLTTGVMVRFKYHPSAPSAMHV